MSNPICFAADFPNLGTAANFIRSNRLYYPECLGAVKVGLEMFIASGPRAIEVFSQELGIPVVLDLKLHDIPETVERAVKAGGDHGVKYMTLHIQQTETLERAVKAAEPFKVTLLGVTVLTSMVEMDLKDLGQSDFTLRTEPSDAIGDRVQELAALAWNCGLRGFVCSPKEVGMLHRKYNDSFFLVPGVRLAGTAAGDQKRVGTPGQAVRDGANFIVVGRPIRDAAHPNTVVKQILEEVSAPLP